MPPAQGIKIKFSSVSKRGVDLLQLPHRDALIAEINHRCTHSVVHGEYGNVAPSKNFNSAKNIGIRIHSVVVTEDGIYGVCNTAGPKGNEVMLEYGDPSERFEFIPRIVNEFVNGEKQITRVIAWDVCDKKD